jgi:hypothetical protein
VSVDGGNRYMSGVTLYWSQLWQFPPIRGSRRKRRHWASASDADRQQEHEPGNQEYETD